VISVSRYRIFSLSLYSREAYIVFQICSPLDAVDYFVSSVADCRSISDHIWLAGALEGYIHTIYLIHKLDLAPIDEIMGKDLKSISSQPNTAIPSDAVKILKLAEDRINEAIQIYSKFGACSLLEADLTLKFARLVEILAPRSDSDFLAKALEFVMRAVAVPGLNASQHLVCIVEGGLICKRLGLTRKYALLTYIAALTSSEGQTSDTARDLVSSLLLL
jgi:hypothetical protein